MATLPMQDPDAAITELERVVKEHGFRSIELGCRVQGELLSETRFRPVLRRAQELGVFVFTHPYVAGVLPPDLGCYYLGNLAAMPFDTALMAAHLMLSGALDDLSKLVIVLAHGGGHLPYQIGRLEHGYRVRKETQGSCAELALEAPAAVLLRRAHARCRRIAFSCRESRRGPRDDRHRCALRHGGRRSAGDDRRADAPHRRESASASSA